MKLGFTGTREGLTGWQRMRLRTLLMDADEAHHGDCVGGDEQFHALAIKAGVPVVIHPPIDPKLRAYCEGAVLVHPEKPYLKRNGDIIKDTDYTVGCPKEGYEPEVARGQGTWSTIRKARNRNKLLEIIWPVPKVKA